MLLALPLDARAPTELLPFRVLAHTGIRLADVVPTGDGLVYIENTTNSLWSAPAAGEPLTRFSSLPRLVEETRCRVSPGEHGWPKGAIFCHAPDNTIYRISQDGRDVQVFARLPERSTADGALSFDTVGTFGYGLVAATGRSGSPTARGGTVYVINGAGAVRAVGSYGSPGGADEVLVAPSRFGVAGGAALLTVDAGSTGSLVAVAADGKSRTIARFPDGPNPIAAITSTPNRGSVDGGLYLADTLSTNAYLAPAAALRQYQGDVIVGGEITAEFWLIHPHGQSFRVVSLTSSLHGKHYNLEGMNYVSSSSG